jgi:hypothetical protein
VKIAHPFSDALPTDLTAALALEAMMMKLSLSMRSKLPQPARPHRKSRTTYTPALRDPAGFRSGC